MFVWFKKEVKTNKEIAIEKFKKAGLTFEEADYLAQDVAELSLYADTNLFDSNEDNVHNLEEAYKDEYYMSTVNTISDGSLPIKAIAYTGIKARAIGLNFEIRIAIKKSVFEYLENNDLDNTHFEKVFMDTLKTVKFNNEKDLLDEINFLYENSLILNIDDSHYNEVIKIIAESIKPSSFIDYMSILLSEGSAWHKQVNSPESQLQKITSLSLTYLGGKLADIKYDILNSNLTPFDILINTNEYKENVYAALEEAERFEEFPKMDDGYRDEVAGRFLQYLQEELRLNIVNNQPKK